jgi:prepilin-type N-terminal cleavage/methylation domain-containing protein
MRRTADRGFTLLEIMIALLILAMGLGAITYANSAAVSHVARITRMTTAAFLVEGVVNDTQAYYVRKGFPTNSLEDKDCDLPRDFAGTFSCSYDLKALDLTPEQIQGLTQATMQKLTGAPDAGGGNAGGKGGGSSGASGLLGGLMGGDGGAEAVQQGLSGAGIQGADMEKIMLLQSALTNPQLQAVCGIQPTVLMSQLATGAMGVLGFLPMIVNQITQRTRQLTVRLSWRDGPRGQRELKVQTFVVAVTQKEPGK